MFIFNIVFDLYIYTYLPCYEQEMFLLDQNSNFTLNITQLDMLNDFADRFL